MAFNTLGMNGNESYITTLSTTLLMGDNSNNSSTDSEGKRKDICSSCNMHSFKILFNNERICDLQGNQAIDIIILILTSHKNRQQREAIRKTWLTYAKNNTANVRYAFLLGFTYDKTIRLTTYDEAKKYNDIIIEDFIDSYGNLTHKSMMAFRWATEFCSHATFVLKIDDDMWLNVPSLLASTQNHNKVLQNGVGGKYKSSQGPMRHGKWRASYKNYPNKLYPAFCAGPGYVTSMGVAKKIFDISKHVPFFHLEDVYIGLCVQKLNLKIYGLKGFNNRKVRYDPCLYKSQKVVTSHHVTPKELLEIWSTNCSQTVKP
ncbi:hypothetical protein KUTeg_009119 [Tegillarca granosa]|uniref:Hexosyltransferase n=1 Tax=Tegillarca granosa TaxID=220873 RepID=A0ABQ9FCC0_TEGGR|nr:hypothetical protein KUTeg_009119 [Tegillarca granosa]